MNPQPPNLNVVHHPDRQRFEILCDDHLAFLSYQKDGARVIIDHTYVPEPLRGRGLAGVLAQAALEAARAQHWTVVPRCSYVATYLQRHPEFAPLVDRAPEA